jgi:abequosyltransferase
MRSAMSATPTSPSLSICIPIYNFARFVPETLDSIVRQDGGDEVEIIVLDGASTDDTSDVIEGFKRKYHNIRYVRMPAKGGIDRDMAKSVEYSTGEYCWLFSGDDWMLEGALRKALNQIKSGHDLYLCKHMEWIGDQSKWIEWPTIDQTEETLFDLGDKDTRIKYFSKAVNTEAFFSFIGGLIVKRTAWDRVPLNEDFVGSCWAHAARMFELMQNGGLTVKPLMGAYLRRRPGNDSFASKGMVERFRISIEGFHKIADRFFGHHSVEAFHVRRVIRHEFHPLVLLLGKYLCAINPKVESKALMDRLVRMAYCDLTISNLRVRLRYALTSAARFRRYYGHICEEHEKAASTMSSPEEARQAI